MAQKKTTPKSRALARSAGRAAGAQRVSAKKTSAKQERAAVSRSISKPTKVAEQGVGWGNVARAAASIVGRVAKSSKPAAKTVKPKTPSKQATAAKKAEVQRQIQREVSQTRANAERAAAKTAESRAARQTAGRAADRRAAEGQRVKKVGKSTGKGTSARYKGDRMIDRKGQGGWR